MANELTFQRIKKVLRSETTIDRLCVAGLITSPLKQESNVTFEFELSDVIDPGWSIPVIIQFDHYNLEGLPDWDIGDALAMVLVENHNKKIVSSSAVRKTYIWRLPAECIENGTWKPINYRASGAFSNLSSNSKSGGVELSRIQRQVKQNGGIKEMLKIQNQESKKIASSSSSSSSSSPSPPPKYPGSSYTPGKNTETIPTLFSTVQNKEIKSAAMLVYCKERTAKRDELTVVSATDFSTDDHFSLSFWDTTQNLLTQYGDWLYLSFVEFGKSKDKNGEDKKYGNVRPRCNIRPATHKEIDKLQKRETHGIIQEDSDDYMVDVNKPRRKRSLDTSNISTSAQHPPITTQQETYHPYRDTLAFGSSPVIQQAPVPKDIACFVRPEENPNTIFNLKNQLQFTSIYNMHAKFNQTSSRIMNFHICGKITQYEPNNLQNWIQEDGAIRFVLHLNDETTARDLPVIFEGEPARELMSLDASIDNKTEHLQTQFAYIFNATIDIAVQAEQDVINGVVITKYIGYGSRIVPSIKRQRTN